MLLSSPAACQRYISTNSPPDIAQQLRLDQQQCKKGGFPSLLAHTLPKSSSRLADEVSLQLLDEKVRYGTPSAIRRLQYDSIINGIKAHLDQLGRNASEESPLVRTIPSMSEFSATLKVLEYLEANPQVAHLKTTSQLPDIITAVRTQLSLPPELRSAYRSPSRSRGPRRKRRKCYICSFLVAEPHELYPSLCKPCGTFNLAESNLSLPDSLSLIGKTALVTGGRVALGFHTALRLLRCGAKVIVSSRYPRDAEQRYLEEHDFEDWTSRLKVVGADFRTAGDVFGLVAVVRKILAEWGQSQEDGNAAKLHILINNAAQTLTDSLASEKEAVDREMDLLEHPTAGTRLVENDGRYGARIRGGTVNLGLEMNRSPTRRILNADYAIKPADSMDVDEVVETEGTLMPTTYPKKSSWVQSLTDIPYEDVITAHSVNTFVPFILCRELLASMASSSIPLASSDSNGPHNEPTAYIINVSSREGIFEAVPTSSAKHGHHVHTNISKAARVWQTHHIAMNTVDPGYMSAAPEFQKVGDCPIGFDDGAARVLWPVAVGETKGEAIWGRFLKHFGEVKVDVGKGR